MAGRYISFALPVADAAKLLLVQRSAACKQSAARAGHRKPGTVKELTDFQSALFTSFHVISHINAAKLNI